MERLLITRKRLVIMALHVLYYCHGSKEFSEKSCGKRQGFIPGANQNTF